MNTLEKFLGHIEVKDSGCWEWTGAKTTAGYGEIWNDGRIQYTHRYAYENFVGSIPEGFEIDHLCKNTICANPEHLEAVTPLVNTRRSNAGKINNHLAAKTHCPRGHPYNEANTYRHNGHRYCRICKQLECRTRRSRIKAH